ncbi:MAG: division/cell wall cluster transcriptional repressor MraZ [Ruminococcaceae bacterium]|nr:division/cell wall cluster transcriptional repressor MraZ [Oscillospiraceae bacterium]
MRTRLFGEYAHTIDKKKRMFLPAKIRDGIGENIIMIKSLSAKCIALYPESEWEKFEEKLESIPDVSGSDVVRRIYSSLAEVQTDPQGRILIPQNLCDYAELEKNVVVIGAGKHAEIWSDVNRGVQAEKENSPELLALIRELGF